MTNSTIDALIVGAGPVGLPGRRPIPSGLNYRLIEKDAVPTDKSKALVLWSRSLELFAPIGVTQAFIDSGNKAKGGSVYADGKCIVHFELPAMTARSAFPS